MESDTSGTGGVDWLARWAAMYDAERQQAEAVTAPEFAIGPDYWETQSARFAAATRRSPMPDAFVRFLLPRLRPDDTLIDIGAGTGRYAVPLARSVRQVLAVEPSPGMRRHMEDWLADERLTNVQARADGWPTFEPMRADIVIAPHVLYGVRDIRPFLEAMDAAATRGCYLLLGVRHPASFVAPFWQQFYGEPRLPLPGALECLCALHQIGVPAQLSTIDRSHPIVFADRDEALADLRFRLRFAPDAARDAEILRAIDAAGETMPDGTIRLRAERPLAAVVWWEK